jgi:hypothetical protein
MVASPQLLQERIQGRHLPRFQRSIGRHLASRDAKHDAAGASTPSPDLVPILDFARGEISVLPPA